MGKLEHVQSDPRDLTHPANRWAQQVEIHTLTDFQVYVQNMGCSVTFLGTPGEERNKVSSYDLVALA